MRGNVIPTSFEAFPPQAPAGPTAAPALGFSALLDISYAWRARHCMLYAWRIVSILLLGRATAVEPLDFLLPFLLRQLDHEPDDFYQRTLRCGLVRGCTVAADAQ